MQEISQEISMEKFYCYDDTMAADPIGVVFFIHENEPWEKYFPQETCTFLRQSGFEGKKNQFKLVPMAEQAMGAVWGMGQKQNQASPFAYAGLTKHLPAGLWRMQCREGHDIQHVLLGFLLGSYHFHLGQKPQKASPCLVIDREHAHDVKESVTLAQTIWHVRDLINRPANFLGPQELADQAQILLEPLGAKANLIKGPSLEEKYPAIAAVGRGSDREGCVFEAHWQGSTATSDSPLLALAGKGVCFDTGGYDLKPSSAMLKMKKDMGGAAFMIGLAGLIICHDWPVRLELRLGCVENSVSGHAMRPSDVISTRKGLTVEIGNTDAEGRLVLCDLLAELSDLSPDLLIDAATLTGAARVALGPDLPALFSNNDEWAEHCVTTAHRHHDPIWRLPLWKEYEYWLDSSVADTGNVSANGMAGAITAALFLQKFVNPGIRWMHIDTYAWNDKDRPGRPIGGEAMALRGLYYALKSHYFG